MKKVFLIIAIFCISIPNIVKAECSTDEKIALSKMVSNIKITPVFNEDTEKFNILISNITPNIYFRDMNTKTNYQNTGGEVVIYNVEPNESYRLKFFSAINACYGETITSTYVTLPGYNKYYKDPLCEGLDEYKICQKWVNYNYDRAKFEEEINKIEKKEVEKLKQQKGREEVKGIYDYLGEIYEKYYYFVLPVIIIGGIILIMRLRKKEDFF